MSKRFDTGIRSAFEKLQHHEIDIEYQTITEASFAASFQLSDKALLDKTVAISPKIHANLHPSTTQWIGIQRHLIKETQRNETNETIYLNQLKSDISEIELFTRNSTQVYFGLDVLKASELCSDLSFPNGLFTEEACQIARYAGISSKIQSFSIGGVGTVQPQTFQIIAEMLWYFIEGYKNRFYEDLANSGNFQTILVEHEALSDSLEILRGFKSGRLWLKKSEKDLPISENELKAIQQGLMPDRVFRFLD